MTRKFKQSKLTPSKIEKLNSLELCPKLRTILNDAIIGWSKPNVKIANLGFGIDLRNPLVFDYDSDGAGCCLLGATRIDQKKINGFLDLDVVNTYDLDFETFHSITKIFDYIDSPVAEYQKQVAQIRDIVFEEEC